MQAGADLCKNHFIALFFTSICVNYLKLSYQAPKIDIVVHMFPNIHLTTCKYFKWKFVEDWLLSEIKTGLWVLGLTVPS